MFAVDDAGVAWESRASRCGVKSKNSSKRARTGLISIDFPFGFIVQSRHMAQVGPALPTNLHLSDVSGSTLLLMNTRNT
jgi:hypothetical protein